MLFIASVSLLIFCLYRLSIDLCGMLVPPLVLSYCQFFSLYVCFYSIYAFRCSSIEGIYICNCCILFLINPFVIMQCTSLSLVTVFVLKHIFNFLISTCMENLFSFLHFQFVCVFRSELSLYAVPCHSVVSYSLQHHEL